MTDERLDVEEHDDFVAAGRFDPTASDAAARLALLVYLTDEIGASIPELVQAHEEGGLMAFAAVRALRPDEVRWTLAESTPSSRPRSGARPGSPTCGRSNDASVRATR